MYEDTSSCGEPCIENSCMRNVAVRTVEQNDTTHIAEGLAQWLRFSAWSRVEYLSDLLSR